MTRRGVVWCVLVCVGVVQTQAPPPRVDVSVQVEGRANLQAVEAANAFNVDLMLVKMNTNNDNYINTSEISNYMATIDTNKNGNIERCEMVGHYRQQLNAPGKVANLLYTVLNDVSNDHLNGSTVFRYDEISGHASLAETRRQILQGVYHAGLLAFEHRDVILTRDKSSLPPSPQALAANLDTNDDGLVSPDEMVTAFNFLDADGDGNISRCELQTSDDARGFDSTPTSLAFDVLDVNSDDVLTKNEFIADLMAADTTVADQRVTREEYATHLAQRMWITRQRAGLPIPPPDYRCDWMEKPLPIPLPAFDVTLWVVDADPDFDDVITQQEYYDLIDTYFERNYNGNLSRCEFMPRSTSRYNVTRRQANAIYDALDANRDNEVSPEDVDVTVADYNGDGQTTTCELYLFMTYLTSSAEAFAARHSVELARRREELFKLALSRQQGGQSDMADTDSALNDYIRGGHPMGMPRDDFLQAWLLALFRKWMAYGPTRTSV